MNSWTKRRLHEVVVNHDSLRKPVKSTERVAGIYPYFGASGVVDYVADFIFDGQYLLIAEDGENLRSRSTPIAFLAEGRFWVNNHAHVVSGNELANTRFLSYAVEQLDISGFLTGSTQPKLTRRALDSLEVLLPPLAEQRAIAEVLGALDDKIAANTRLAATADALIQTMFKESIRCSPREARLLDEFDVVYGEPFGGGNFTEPGEGRPLIRIRDLKTFTSQIWTSETRSRETTVVPGDIVVGMDAEFRATRWLGNPGLLNQRVCLFRHEKFAQVLVKEAITRPLIEVENEKSATTVIHLNKADLLRKHVLVPNDEEANRFESGASPLHESIVRAAMENQTLTETRDALLPKLMSGQLRVRDIEI